MKLNLPSMKTNTTSSKPGLLSRSFLTLLLSSIALALWAMPSSACGQLLVTYTNTIGEYTTAGTPVGSGTLVSALTNPFGIAVSGSDIFVASFTANTIGEYTTSGATVNASLISSGLSSPEFIAVSGSDIFVANNGFNEISEYTTSGALVTQAFIPGISNPTGIAISGTIMYVASYGNHTIGEYS